MASRTSESRVRSTSRDGEERASSPHHHEQHLPSRDLGRSHLASIS